MSAPGGEELDQPGGGRVGDGGLEAAATQDQQRVLLGVQAGGGSHTPGDEPQDERRLEPGADHYSGGKDQDGSRGGGSGENGREAGDCFLYFFFFFADHLLKEPGRHENSSPAHIQATCVYSREWSGGG